MKRFLDWATSSFQDDFTGTLSALIAALIAIIFFCLSFSVANASTTTIQVVNGGTGTSTTPSYGQLLIGGHNSEYEFISTSTLNLTTSAFASPNISQWTNNAGYLISESDPLSLHLTTWYATTSAPQLTTLGNLSTVGTITSGTWHGTAIADSYISSSGNWNTAYSDRIASANYPLSISSNALSIVATSSENCTVSCFASANISQWTNNSGYLTSTGIESTSTNPLMATYFVATGTVASNLPYASTTAWSITSTSTGSDGINLSGGCFAISGTCIGGGAGGGVSSVSATWPVVSSGGTTPTISWNGISTSTNLTAPDLLYATGAKTVGQVATSSAACSGFITCSGFTVVGSVSPTITTTGTLSLSSGGTAASLSGAGGIVAMNSGNTALSIPSASYTLSSSLLTAPNASTTNFTAGSSNPFLVGSTGEISGYDVLTATQGQISPMRYLSFTIATSSTWTGTSSASSALGDSAHVVVPFTGTIRTLSCSTSAGTLEIELSVNSLNDYYPASTTAGIYTFSTAFTKGQQLNVVGGNSASSPTFSTCTLGATQTA